MFSRASATRVAAVAGIGLATVLLPGCGGEAPEEQPGQARDADPIVRVETVEDVGEIRDRLIVLTLNRPTTYMYRAKLPTGFEYELVSAFAAHLGLPLEVRTLTSVKGLLDAMEKGSGQVVAAGLVKTPAREQRFTFGPAYGQVAPTVVCHASDAPTKRKGLTGRTLLVSESTSYPERLREVMDEHPDLDWQEVDSSSDSIMARIAAAGPGCTVVDSTLFRFHRRFYPKLRAIMSLGAEQELAWIVHPRRPDLQSALAEWLPGFVKSPKFDVVWERLFGDFIIFDPVDYDALRRRIGERLPPIRALFEEAGAEYDIPWTILAAQSYQESLWDPKARSPTGVRGLMMLTQRTARSLGVEDRVDPRQSVMGGGRYLRQLIDATRASLPEETRLVFALISYNVGSGHLADARGLAERLGKNPDRPKDVIEVLPLLSEPKYYETLRYGYARGHEPVRYVTRIMNYVDIIEHELDEHLMTDEPSKEDPS